MCEVSGSGPGYQSRYKRDDLADTGVVGNEAVRAKSRSSVVHVLVFILEIEVVTYDFITPRPILLKSYWSRSS